ncbi:MAG: DUF5686 family protein, partial [Bacteroidota bacterium]
LLVTANPDSINGALDSIYKIQPNGEKKFVEVDSSNFELKEQLSKAHLYITEKISEYAFNRQKGKRETVLATRMAGFKDPIYEFLGIQLQSFSFYGNTYTVFGTSYTNPLAGNALNKYTYKILDTVTRQNRPAYMMYYKPKNKEKTAGLEGVLYIDMESYALQKAIAQLKAVIDVKASQEFQYYEKENIWFPVSKEIRVKKGENNEAISLFGNTVRIRSNPQQKDSTVLNSNDQDASELIYLITTEKNTNIRFNTPVVIKGRGLAIDFATDASKRDPSFWSTYRTDTISQRGEATYRIIDSIVEKENIEGNIKLARKLLQGYYPTKYIDLDLRYLLKYNGYEGFRIGMGGVTNTDFSPKYRLNAYAVYGTKDREFKYGLGAAARLNRFTNTWLGGTYTDDLVETGSYTFITDGRSFSLFEPRLFNIEQFHKNRSISAYLAHDLTPKIQTKLQVTSNTIDPTYDYTFINDGEAYSDFKTTTTTFALQWNPFSKYMMTPGGKREIKNGYPKFTVQLTQGVKGMLSGDFNFTKFNLRAYHEIKPLNKGTTSFFIEGGVAFGELPITELYHSSPNNPNKGSLMRRFSVAGRNSFETMYFNEFFSDRYVTLEGKHKFRRFKISEKFRPELVLISRFALGDADRPENHMGLSFNSLNKGYLESGIELNKLLLQGFGLSFFYRYGAYHLPEFDRNISFKFTYYFSLGF